MIFVCADGFLKGGYFGFFSNLFNTASSAAPQIKTVSEDARIDPRTVANTALAVRRSSHPFVIFVCAGGLAGLCGLAAGSRVQYMVPLALPVALSPLIPSIQVGAGYRQTPIVRHLFSVLRIRDVYPRS